MTCADTKVAVGQGGGCGVTHVAQRLAETRREIGRAEVLISFALSIFKLCWLSPRQGGGSA